MQLLEGQKIRVNKAWISGNVNALPCALRLTLKTCELISCEDNNSGGEARCATISNLANLRIAFLQF